MAEFPILVESTAGRGLASRVDVMEGIAGTRVHVAEAETDSWMLLVTSPVVFCARLGMTGRCLMIGFLLIMAFPAALRANILINGGLETTLPITEPDNLVYASPTYHKNALKGWTITSGTIDVVPNSYFQADQGNFSVDLVGTPGIGSIEQSFATTPGDLYGLTFEFSINPENLAGESGTTKILQIQALGANGSSVLASLTYQDTAGTRTNADMEYEQETFQFVADGKKATLTLAALPPLNLPDGETAATCYCGPVVDALDLEDLGSSTPPTPEPASLGMLALGSILLLGARRPFHRRMPAAE